MKRALSASLIAFAIFIGGCSGGGSGGDGEVQAPTSPEEQVANPIPWFTFDQLRQEPITIPLISAEGSGGMVTIVTTPSADARSTILDISVTPPVSGIGITAWLKRGTVTFIPDTVQHWTLSAKDSDAARQVAIGRMANIDTVTSTMLGVVFLDQQLHQRVGQLKIDGVTPSDAIALHFDNK